MSEVFEWALIRVVPRVERGEAINAGVIVYSKSFRYLKTRIELDERRLRALDPGADVAAVHGALHRVRAPPCTDRAASPRPPSASGSAGSPPRAPRSSSRARSTAACHRRPRSRLT